MLYEPSSFSPATRRRRAVTWEAATGAPVPPTFRYAVSQKGEYTSTLGGNLTCRLKRNVRGAD